MAQQTEGIIIELKANFQEGLKAIGEYRQGIETLKAQQKEYKEQLDKEIISKKAYHEAMAQTNAQIKFNQENVRILNKELQNNIKQEKALTGSADAMKARLSNLTAQYNQLGDAQEDAAQKNALGQEIATITDSLTEQEKALGNFRRQVGNYEVATKSIRGELKMLTEQIGQMKLAGREGTAEYVAAIERASQVKDAFGDAAREINVGASDTGGLDKLKGSVELLAGSFTALNALQGAFTQDQEKMNKLVQNVQMGIGALSAAIALQNALQKEGVVMTMIATVQAKARAKALALETAATGKGTIAQGLFNAVAAMNPYVLLAMALVTVVGLLAVFAMGAESAAEKQEKLNQKQSAHLDYLGYEIKKLEDLHQARIKEAETALALAKAKGENQDSLAAREQALGQMKLGMYEELSAAAQKEIDNLEGNKRRVDYYRQLLEKFTKIPASKKVTFTGSNGENIKESAGKAIEIINGILGPLEKGIEVAVNITTRQKEEQDKQTLDAAQKVKDEATAKAAAYKEMRQKEKEAIRQAEDAVVDLLKEGQGKQILNLKKQYARQIEDLKGKLTTETNLTTKAKQAITKTITALERQKELEINEVNKTFDKETFDRKVKERSMIIEAELLKVRKGTDQEFQLKKEALDLAMKEEIRVNAEKEEHKRVDQAFIYAKYDALITEAEKTRAKEVADQLRSQAQMNAENELLEMQLSGRDVLALRLSQKRQEIDALQQMDGESDRQYLARKKELLYQEKQLEENLKTTRGSQTEDPEMALKILQKQEELAALAQLQDESDAEFLNRQLQLKNEILGLEKEQQDAVQNTASTKKQETNDMLTAVGGAFGAISKLMEENAQDNEALAVFSKALALTEIGINTGVAIAKGVSAAQSVPFPGNIAAIATTVTAVLANVMSAYSLLNKQQKPKAPKLNSYATGGLIIGAGSGTSDSITARVSSGESIMTQRATQMFAPMLSSFNQIGGGVPIQAQNTAAQVMGEDMLARAFARGVAALPNPVVAVQEIAQVQNRVAVIESLRNF